MVISSVWRGRFSTGSGFIFNKFNISSRRDVLFFEDVISSYVKHSENSGFSSQIENIAYTWSRMYIDVIVPKIARRTAKNYILNKIFPYLWKQCGLLDGFHVEFKDDNIYIETKNEMITRTICENRFIIGLYRGLLEALINDSVLLVSAFQDKKYSRYIFKKLGKKPTFDFLTKSRTIYKKLNSVSGTNGAYMKRFIEEGIFREKNNKLYFKKKRMVIGDPTLFHLFGEKNICLEIVEDISHSLFKDVYNNITNPEKKMEKMRNLHEAMGLGKMCIIMSNNSIDISLKNLPCGVQKGGDNRKFLIAYMKGLMKGVREDLHLENFYEKSRNITMHFER